MRSGSRTVLLVVAAATLWYAATLAFWATRSLSDSVPVGIDYSSQPAKAVSQSVECHSPISSSARDRTPLPVLREQPKTAPPLDYQREPCVLVHHQARLVFVIDSTVIVLMWLAAAWAWRWRIRRRPTDDHRAGDVLIA